MKHFGIIKKILFIFLVFFLLSEVIFLLLPKIVDTKVLKPQITKVVEHFVGVDFSFDTMKIKTYPDFSMLILVENPKVETLADIKNFELKVGLPKLVLKQLSIKKVKIDEANLYLTKYDDGLTNVEKILNRLPFHLNLRLSDILINDFKFFAKDEKIGQKLNVKGDFLSAKIYRNDLDLKIKAEIEDEKNVSQNALINLDVKMPMPDLERGFRVKNKYLLAVGFVKNLRLEIFEEFLKAYVDKDILDIKGVINADFKPTYENNKLKAIEINVIFDGLKILSKKPENSIIFSEKNIVNSKLVVENKDLVIEKFDFSGDKVNVDIKGKINNYKAETPKLLINIDIKDTRAEKVYWMLPSNLFTDLQEIKKIKKYGAYGLVNGNIEIKGKLTKPEIYGDVKVNDIWILDGLPNDVPKAVVDVGLKKDKVFVDVKVWATPEEYVTVKGHSSFYDLSDNEYQINSTENVPLEVAQKMLPPVSDVLGFVIGPVPIMDIKGLGSIDLNAKGSQKNPTLNGLFTFRNATAEFNEIRVLKLENAKGRIDFKKDKVYFENTEGTILGQPAKISGISDIKVDIDYVAKVDNAPLDKLLQTLKTSPMLKDYAKKVAIIKSADGRGDLYLRLKGHFDDPNMINDPDVVKYITPSGFVDIKNSNVKLENPKVLLNNAVGKLKIDGERINLDFVGDLFSSPVKIFGQILENNADLTINSKKMKLVDSAKVLVGLYSDIAQTVNLKDISQTTTFSMDMEYKGSIEKIELNKTKLSAKFPTKNNSDAFVDVLSGSFDFNNGNVIFNKINSKIYNTTAFLNGKIDNIFKRPNVNMTMSVYKLDLSMLNSIKNSDEIPEKIQKILNAYKDYKGIVSVDLKVKNNEINGNIWLRDISFVHSILEYPFLIKTGNFEFLNNKLIVDSFNATFANTPLFLKGSVDNVTKNPKFDIYFTSKLSKDFVDNYINTNLSYPINVKGEVLLSSNIKGTKNEINIYPSVRLEEGADISYMGANFGDENSIREIKGQLVFSPQKFIVKNLDYFKYIYSQNNRLYPISLVNIKSEILMKKKVFINYLNIKTQNPIGANIFNILFKKSLVKNGNVSCDLKIKGDITTPQIFGYVILKNVDIPLYDTLIENVKIDFNQKYIDIVSRIGYLGSYVNVAATLDSNIYKSIHFNDIEVFSHVINLNSLLDSLNKISYSRPIQIVGQQNVSNTQELPPMDLDKIIIEKGKLQIDKIEYKNLPISNFSSKIDFKNGKFNIKDTKLDIAGGILNGDIKYDFEKALINIDANVDDVDANIMSEGLFDIKNQIHGKLDGKTTLTTFGANDEERMKNLSGNLSFDILSGRMPKLGSIEYLLRAGNLIKGGISGLTLNNLTGLLIPMETGDFEAINGVLNIENGKINDMKISSKGQNLSILITGTFDLISSQADLKILGKLSKNIDTILGPIGNTSLNSIFNLIPGVHLDELLDTELIRQINAIPELGLATDKFRIFRATVDGDIYSEKFVSKFEWIGSKSEK